MNLFECQKERVEMLSDRVIQIYNEKMRNLKQKLRSPMAEIDVVGELYAIRSAALL